MTDIPIIRRLEIQRFRGIESLDWHPAYGMNVIIGGGDSGKTTILDAISLLISPSNTIVLSESDYWMRNSENEFLIEATLSLPATSGISQQSKFAWPWEWDGEHAVLPSGSDNEKTDSTTSAEPVYRLRARGTSNLELIWEIIQPDDSIDHLSVGVRRSIGLVRLGGDDRNDRDLRLVYGSALDRLLSDNGLRARIGQQIANIDIKNKLEDTAKTALDELDEALKKEALPNKLDLGLTSSQGISIGSLIGLLANKEGVSLPLTSWGAGTRRMTTLEIAASTTTSGGITLIDEIERGLEPYRLRKLIKALQKENNQTFLTTHSAVAITSSTEGSLWYLDIKGNIGELQHSKIHRQQQRDPETFLSKLAVIAEGPTEVGFLSYIIEKALETQSLELGVRVCDGQGNTSTLDLLEAMSSAGLAFAGFVDNEGKFPGRWKNLREKFGDALFQWDMGCTEQNVVAEIDEILLPELIKDDDGLFDGDRLRTLADRLSLENKEFDNIKANTDDLRKLIIEAATGDKSGASIGREKEWAKHAQKWFKSEVGGRELAQKMVSLGAWTKIQAKVSPLINYITGLKATTKIEL